jgi:hypothetical protein
MADGYRAQAFQDSQRLTRAADNVDDLTGRHNLELSHKAEEVNDGTIALNPCGAAGGAPALLAGEGVGRGDVLAEQILDLATHGGVIAKAKRTLQRLLSPRSSWVRRWRF